jgi:hypothetical protein
VNLDQVNTPQAGINTIFGFSANRSALEWFLRKRGVFYYWGSAMMGWIGRLIGGASVGVVWVCHDRDGARMGVLAFDVYPTW